MPFCIWRVRIGEHMVKPTLGCHPLLVQALGWNEMSVLLEGSTTRLILLA